MGHASSTKKGRTKNMDNAGSNGPIPLNIDDPNHSYSGSSNNGAGCCYKCIFYWWFWAFLWIIGIGGVVVPVLGYFDIFADQCTDKIISDTSQIAINTDTETQGNLNIL